MSSEIDLARRNAKRDLRAGLDAEIKMIDGYLDGYEFRREAGGGVRPNRRERAMLVDAILGLTGNPDFRAAVAQNESRRKLLESLPPEGGQ